MSFIKCIQIENINVGGQCQIEIGFDYCERILNLNICYRYCTHTCKHTNTFSYCYAKQYRMT